MNWLSRPASLVIAADLEPEAFHRHRFVLRRRPRRPGRCRALAGGVALAVRLVPGRRVAPLAGRALGGRFAARAGLARGLVRALARALVRRLAVALCLVAAGAQQQRRVALQQDGQRGGHVGGRHIVLLLVLLDQLRVDAEIAAGQRVGDALQEAGDALVVDLFGGRQRWP